MTQALFGQRLEVFFATKGKYLLYAILVIAMIGVVAYRFLMPANGDALKDYFDAKIQIERLGMQNQDVQDALNALIKNKFARNFNDVIAQNLALQGKWQEALIPASNAIKHAFPDDSPYSRYSQITLAIEKNEVEQALADSKELQKELEPGLLFAYNLFRIAILSDGAESSQAWQAWDEFSSKKENANAMSLMEGIFNQGNCCLKDFVDARK